MTDGQNPGSRCVEQAAAEKQSLIVAPAPVQPECLEAEACLSAPAYCPTQFGMLKISFVYQTNVLRSGLAHLADRSALCMNLSDAPVDAFAAKRKRLIFASERSTPVTRCAFFNACRKQEGSATEQVHFRNQLMRLRQGSMPRVRLFLNVSTKHICRSLASGLASRGKSSSSDGNWARFLMPARAGMECWKESRTGPMQGVSPCGGIDMF